MHFISTLVAQYFPDRIVQAAKLAMLDNNSKKSTTSNNGGAINWIVIPWHPALSRARLGATIEQLCTGQWWDMIERAWGSHQTWRIKPAW